MDDDSWKIILALIFLVVCAGLAGYMAAIDDVKDDCQNFEAFMIGSQKYECREVYGVRP